MYCFFFSFAIKFLFTDQKKKKRMQINCSLDGGILQHDDWCLIGFRYGCRIARRYVLVDLAMWHLALQKILRY